VTDPRATLGVVKPIVTVSGPPDAGPGERELMLDRARAALAQLGAESTVRIDVPGKGSGEETADSGLRVPVQQIVPALQSGSLFGGVSGLMVVDAQALLKVEAEVLAELVQLAADGSVAAVFVASGAIPAPLGSVLRKVGETLKVGRVSERDATQWLVGAARDRGVSMDGEAVALLIQRFGSDLAALGRALDQLAVDSDRVGAAMVRDRFKSRPDEPMWYYADAVVAGDQGEALRRLSDFLEYGHPLQLLGYLQSDLRRRCLAAAAPDYETYLERAGGSRGYAAEKVWKARTRTRASDLQSALSALARADLQMKTAPEVTHRVTLERLTVALCRWYGGRRS